MCPFLALLFELVIDFRLAVLCEPVEDVPWFSNVVQNDNQRKDTLRDVNDRILSFSSNW